MHQYLNPPWFTFNQQVADEKMCNPTSYLKYFDEFIDASNIAHAFFGQMIPVSYLLDYRTGRYERMTDSFAGYQAHTFLDKGLELMLHILDQEHLRLYNQKIFPERLRILSGIDPKEHQNYIFSLNSTVTHRDGFKQDFLQRNNFISDARGNPLFSMGILINLNYYNDRYPIIQTVEKIDPMGVNRPKIVDKKSYTLTSEKPVFSAREIEVLNWMASGLSSKQIAQKMFLSEYTVINHRRNMQVKAKQPNAVSLIIFAVRQGII